jgi:YHS domain-containing protein
MKQTLKKSSRILSALALAGALSLGAFAQDAKDAKKAGHGEHHHGQAAKAEEGGAKFLGKGDGVETCPVTGEAITTKDTKAEMFGRTVLFCCEGCLGDAKKNPALYVKPTLEEQRAAIKANAKDAGHGHHAQDAEKADGKFLGKGDGVKTCPVTGEEISKDVKAEISGRTVYFCCEGCIDTVKKNPDLYLKKAENQ